MDIDHPSQHTSSGDEPPEEKSSPLPQPIRTGENEQVIRRAPGGPFSKVAKYLLTRIVSIGATIFIGVFITVVIANKGGQIDVSVHQEVAMEVAKNLPPGYCLHYCDITPEKQSVIDALQSKYEHAAGLNLPFLPRHVLWTIRTLGLNLGRAVRYSGTSGSYYSSPGAPKAILADFPHTLMLVGPAFFLLFTIGIPLALYLFRKHGSRLDQLFSILTPVSSIPSWVLGVILILIFAVGLRWMPPSGMFGTVPPANFFGKILQVLQHMTMPVLAIFLSLFFQCLYAWKTFFLLYSSEDFVDLAKAKGLPPALLEKRYILRPTLPYILTNFALLLVSFWQMTMVLEVVFNWPGIGRMYINSLPNFNGESMFYGIMPIIVEIVAIFAYILGITVLVLDILYAVLDPRIRLGGEGQTARLAVGREWKRFRFGNKFRPPAPRTRPRADTRPAGITGVPASPDILASDKPRASEKKLGPWVTSLREIRRYPTAVAGLAIILLLVIGSVIAVTAFPFGQLAGRWYNTSLTGKSYVPKLAAPVWVNWLRKDPLPSSIFLDSANGTAQKSVQPPAADGTGRTTITYHIDYPYSGYPQDLTLYFTSHYDVKRPFLSFHWLTPDGRTMALANMSPETGIPFNLNRDLNPYEILPDYPAWQKWFVAEKAYNSTPHSYLLFSDPARDKPVALPGRYTLQLDITTFEAGSSVDAELVLLGKVYGWAGTDYLRRDLLVPLLWGMPFALALGLVGASLTTILSMIIAAAGVWFGGWLDDLVQRLIEGIMILPVVAIGVIFYAFFNMSIWTFLALIALLNVFGSPTKSFRAALLQVKDAPFVEWAKASGAGNLRIILHYLVPSILPTFIPQLVALIPTYVFLEATLGIFGIKSNYPTWGKIIYEAIRNGALYGSGYWVLEPIALLLLTGLAFAMLGFALERILNPRLTNE